MAEYNYYNTCSKLLKELPQKQQEVLLRRFGVGREERETLEKIGRDFGVTRERIRQIEKEALKKLERKKEERELKKIFYLFNEYLKRKGGLKREDLLLSELGGSKFKNEVYFLLHLGDDFNRFTESEKFYTFWAIEKNLLEKVVSLLESLVSFFQKEKKPLFEDELPKVIKEEKPEVLMSSVEVSKHIEKGPLGHVGLVNWPEIKPKGVRDKAYLALKKAGEPLHFRDIAVYSSELEGEACPKKQVLPQTVHNELIKDGRFVLVGRGIYALKEWGYNPGTVKDIIASVLKKAKKPLSKEEIINEVLKQRIVKENTILLNLQNKNFFSRTKEGKYTLA
jgi:DNA-directed RNA polymerase delta subunit